MLGPCNHRHETCGARSVTLSTRVLSEKKGTRRFETPKHQSPEVDHNCRL
jgi:hypothetical protein